MKDKQIPKIIQKVGFDFSWDEEKVWVLDEKATEMNLKDLEWHFDIPFLWENGVYNLKPRKVLTNPGKYSTEYARTLEADLIYPIDIMENKRRWLILDGLHRLMKAKTLNQSIVKVRKIPRTRIPEILKS